MNKNDKDELVQTLLFFAFAVGAAVLAGSAILLRIQNPLCLCVTS
jgi:hypothetical protein